MDAAIDLTTLQLRFKARKTSATYGSLEIGVMSDPHDPSTFTLVKSLDGSMYDGTNQWQEFVTYFNGYTGTGRYIALRAPGYFTNYVHVDDVEVNYIAGCGMPSHFHVVSTTGTVATLAWQTGDRSDASDVYTIEYSEQGLDNWMSVTTTNTQFFLTNLNPLTAYDVRLYVLCDNGTSDTLTAMFNTTASRVATSALAREPPQPHTFLPTVFIITAIRSRSIWPASWVARTLSTPLLSTVADWLPPRPAATRSI